MTASADRAGGVFAALTLWDTAADREASNSALEKTRQEALEVIGGEMSVENFEQVVEDRSKPPVVGSSVLMVTRVSMDPAKIDDNVAFFKSEVLPRIKATPGYLGLRNMINRETGDGVVGTGYEDQKAMEAAAADAQSRRQEAVARGVSFGETSLREIVFADLR